MLCAQHAEAEYEENVNNQKKKHIFKNFENDIF